MALEAVIFDLDDTLVVEAAVARASLRSAAERVLGMQNGRAEDAILGAARAVWQAGPHHQLALDLGIASWEGLWASFEGCHPSLDGLASWIPTYRKETWASALGALGLYDAALGRAMAAAYEQAQRAGHPLLEGAAEVVRDAAGRYRLGLLTNGPPDIQRLKVSQSGLATCFQAVVISGEVGVGKPSSKVFALALDALGVGAEEAVMVGDSWERDVAGALGAGIRPIWIAGARSTPEPHSGVARAASIFDVPNLLER